jgi:hypothetical protein
VQNSGTPHLRTRTAHLQKWLLRRRGFDTFYKIFSEISLRLPALCTGCPLTTLELATHVTASMTSLHDQSFCTRTHKIPSPPHGTSTLEQALFCTWNMSSSDDDELALAAFVLMCKRKPRKKKRDVWRKDWL